MLDPKFVMENSELVVKKAAVQGAKINLDELKVLSGEKKNYLQKTEDLRYKRNKASQLVARKKKRGRRSLLDHLGNEESGSGDKTSRREIKRDRGEAEENIANHS